MKTHDERYESVLAAVGKAMAEAGALGWQGYEAQAHIFLAMFDAAEGREPIPAPPPPAEATFPEPEFIGGPDPEEDR